MLFVWKWGRVFQSFIFHLWLCLASLDCFTWLGVPFFFYKDPRQTFFQFRRCQASTSEEVVWGTIWVGVVSEIWKHWNSVIFNRGVADAVKVFVLAQVNVWSWIYAKSSCDLFPYSNWVLNSLDCMRMIR